MGFARCLAQSRFRLDGNHHARAQHRRDNHAIFPPGLRYAVAHPLSYPASDRLMHIYQHTKYGDMSTMPNQDFFAAHSALRSFESVAGYLDMAMRI